MEPLNVQHEGRTLRGTLHLPQEAPAPAVVLCHGFSGNRTEFGHTFVRLGRRLAERGVAAYRFDFAGGGESDGEYGDITVSDQVSQVLAVLDAVGAHSGVDADRLSLLGMSLGGLTASLAAAKRQVRSLALWAPAAIAVDAEVTKHRQAVIAEHGYDDFGGTPIFKRYADDAETIDAFADARGHTGPVLLAAGSEDNVFGPGVFDGYHDLYESQLEYHKLNGVGHGFETVPAREHLLELTEAFLLRHM
ncbi:alpha/beta hydrolase family protein [Glycomyces tritici]|uniref:Alpha/beta fold hydrolase n=1 Tax=Glycomyces tritici TaxID=2665176 RepID=A0ABT7YUP1_9ACTN|nr:alpha/beta fold hydrolase [Glycomyces tritici]MDN3241567.1 alpha/beta fold hydrolase [Glycomyces tritici]MDN3242354.1 alpha/beta fold hydrolase [Glycomyces tritici]